MARDPMFWRVAQRCKDDPKIWVFVQLANLAGIVGGYYYYWSVGQIRPGSEYYESPGWWAFITDSPNAVLLMFIVLTLHAFGKRSTWLDALAYLHMTFVGLWTTFLFLTYPDQFGTFSWGGTNNMLFFTHMGMPIEALILLPQLRKDVVSKWLPPVVLAWAAFNLWLDYGPRDLRPAPFATVGPELAAGSVVLMAIAFAGMMWGVWPGLKSATARRG